MVVEAGLCGHKGFIMRSLQLNCAVVSAELYGSFSSTTKWLNLTWEKVFQKFMDVFLAIVRRCQIRNVRLSLPLQQSGRHI